MISPRPMQEEEYTSSLEPPAVYANRFFVTAGTMVRISFAEEWQPGTGVRARQAVVLTVEDAIELANLLKSLLEPANAGPSQTAEEGNG